MDAQEVKAMTEDDWKKKLTPEQYHVLREAGTERPGSGQLLHNEETGEYTCAACGAIVFKSDEKYDSTTPGLIGWPSFGAATDSGAVELREDNTLGMSRTEAICNQLRQPPRAFIPGREQPHRAAFLHKFRGAGFQKSLASNARHQKTPSEGVC